MDSYICIDLKSFFASVECVDRGLDPMKAKLVVADAARTDKTICLAVTPALKAYGLSGRSRLFEVKQRLGEIKARTGEEIPFIIAPPRMARYIAVSSDVYEVYLKYIAPEDMHVYSVDEVFIDCRRYLKLYDLTAHELAERMIHAVLEKTGITATAGIGTNLYLAKVAMDIVAKKSPADKNGVRIAELDEEQYRRLLWNHQPLTDFWQIGSGTVKRLNSLGLYTMGDIARCSLGRPDEFYNEELLFRMLGVNAELLIDHAWGIEHCTMEDIKNYRPSSESTGIGQVLQRPYDYGETKIIVREMVEQLILQLVDKKLITDAIVLHIGYDRENTGHKGPYTLDHYGRKVPRAAHGTANLGGHTALKSRILPAVMGLYEEIIDKALTVRRVNVTAIRILPEDDVVQQMDLFLDSQQEKREIQLQRTILWLKKKYGNNAVLKGMDFLPGATARERNKQIGGHKA